MATIIEQLKLLFATDRVAINSHPDLRVRRLAAWIQYFDAQTLILVLLYFMVGTIALFYGNKTALTSFGFVSLINLGGIYCSKLGCKLGTGGMFLIAAGLNTAWLVATIIIIVVFMKEGRSITHLYK